MFRMRPAGQADEPQIAALITARAAWMRKRGLVGWEGWASSAQALAEQAGDLAFPVWVLKAEDSRIAGVTSLYDHSPDWCWTEAERADPEYFLATTVTDPAFRADRPGCLIAWWALDHAAREGRTWVRRGTGPYPGLVRYYCEVQGWTLVRSVERDGVTAYAMQRRAEPQPQLAAAVELASLVS